MQKAYFMTFWAMQYIIKPWVGTCGIKVPTASPRVGLNSTWNWDHVSLTLPKLSMPTWHPGTTLQDLFGSFLEELAYKNVLSKSLISFVYIGARKEFPPSLETQSIHGLNFIYKTKYIGMDVRLIWIEPDAGYLFSKQISKPPKPIFISFHLFLLWKHHSHHWEILF